MRRISSGRVQRSSARQDDLDDLDKVVGRAALDERKSGPTPKNYRAS